MFDDLRPDQIPAPPPNALPDAVRRGTGIRRRRRAAWAGGVAAAVVLGIAVLLGDPFSSTDSAIVVPATSTPTPPADYSPIPESPSEAKGVTFGFIEDVKTQADGSLVLRIQPGFFYTGDEATKFNGGESPLNDYVDGEKEGTSPVDLRLDPRAPLQGTSVFAAEEREVMTERVSITADQLVQQWEAKDPGRALVWFRQAADGSITALSEQYVP